MDEALLAGDDGVLHRNFATHVSLPKTSSGVKKCDRCARPAFLKFPRSEVESVTQRRRTNEGHADSARNKSSGFCVSMKRGAKAPDLRRRHGISAATFDKW